jgi:uncharacterized membrane protein
LIVVIPALLAIIVLLVFIFDRLVRIHHELRVARDRVHDVRDILLGKIQ